MRRVWTLAALPAVALFVGASPAGAAHIDTSVRASATDAGVGPGAGASRASVGSWASPDTAVPFSTATSGSLGAGLAAG